MEEITLQLTKEEQEVLELGRELFEDQQDNEEALLEWLQ